MIYYPFLAGLIHLLLILLLFILFEYDSNVSTKVKIWIGIGMIATGIVPTFLFSLFGLISPVIFLLLAFLLMLRAELGSGLGEPLGAVYIGLWPLFLLVYILVGVIEYII
ncbi:hypothetical protein [Halorussus aquaticus]|uniref:hypothetical protein n=1 Tax=Halorussus aquaticus TaxID=2953748 RepID=UPI0036D4036E